jgi:uncharacterized protein YbgA (DUF1722 family)/uncharacterized protein YbbK (DUF523 family)
MTDKLKIGISACLLGEEVRYDGTHQLNRFISDTLGKYVEFIPVCPEVESGFPVPREPFRLVGDPEAPRLVMVKSGTDQTDKFLKWAKRRVRELEPEDLCGFIFKRKSPSCGMQGVKVFTEEGMPSKRGVGLFARVFIDFFPLIPVEDEGRMNDPGLRENFIERIFTLQRWRQAISKRKSLGVLVDFHTRQKMLILSHSPADYRTMGKLVASPKKYPLGDLYDRYQELLMSALKLKATPSKNTNVLQHIQGYFKKMLSPDEKQELVELIGNYRNGLIPLIVPVTIINHYVRKYDQPYLKEQHYLNPHPLELQLRNHV